MKLDTKEKVHYGTAIVMIASAIILVFVSFFLTYTIGSGVLTYVGEAFGGGLAIFGVANYFKIDAEAFKSEIRNELNSARLASNTSQPCD